MLYYGGNSLNGWGRSFEIETTLKAVGNRFCIGLNGWGRSFEIETSICFTE